MVVTEDENLELGPYFVEIDNEVVRVFGKLIQRGELGLHIIGDKGLYVFPDELVDLYFVPGGRFILRKLVDVSK